MMQLSRPLTIRLRDNLFFMCFIVIIYLVYFSYKFTQEPRPFIIIALVLKLAFIILNSVWFLIFNQEHDYYKYSVKNI